MARVPISFHLSILAGIIVLFNHYAASETGDVALNKITGATGRFYALFRDTALTFQHGCASRLETALCRPSIDSLLPHDAVAYLKAHYCPPFAQDSDGVGGTTGDRHPHGGYGGSDFAFVHYQPLIRPRVPHTSAEDLGRPFGLGGPNQRRLSRVAWHRSSEAMATIGTLLLRTYASWWWFQAPLQISGVLLAASSALLTVGYVLGANVLRCVSEACVVVVADFLWCIEWEAQRQVWDVGVVTMERAYGLVTRVCKTHTEPGLKERMERFI